MKKFFFSAVPQVATKRISLENPLSSEVLSPVPVVAGVSLTYELVQEDEWGDVAGQTEELAHNHEPVPRLNGQRHHQQLRQDKGGEGNGHDVDEFRLEQQHRSVHDDTSCRGKAGGQLDKHSVYYHFLCSNVWITLYQRNTAIVFRVIGFLCTALPW